MLIVVEVMYHDRKRWLAHHLVVSFLPAFLCVALRCAMIRVVIDSSYQNHSRRSRSADSMAAVVGSKNADLHGDPPSDSSFIDDQASLLS